MRRFATLLVLSAFIVTLGACSRVNRTPRYDVDKDYNVVPFKRYAKHTEQDFYYNFHRAAYRKVEEPLDTRLSETQKDVLARHGQPDYVREHWYSDTGEIIDEWAYWDRDVIVQFVQHELVFEGELTDMDRWRIRYGYPNDAYQQTYEAGVRRDLWKYRGVYETSGTIVTFSDEKLVSRQSY